MFYDDVLKEAKKGNRESIAVELAHVPGIYEVSNVAEYFFAQSQEEYWPASKFPCCVPPHPITWIESKRPSCIDSVVHGRQRWTGPDRWGFLIYRHDLHVFYKDRPAPWIWAEGRDSDGIKFEIPTSARWLLHCYSFFEMLGQIVPSGECRLILDEAGGIIPFTALGPVHDRSIKEGVTRDWTDHSPGRPHEWYYTPPALPLPNDERGRSLVNDFAHEVRRLCEPVWLALSFLHCSNTVVEEGVHPRPERRRALRENRPLCRFEVLRVEPITHVVHPPAPPKEGDTRTPVEPGHVSLHIRRGTMRDYRQGKGLFGKIHKLVWVDQMRVGSAKAGEVKKVYEVGP